MECQLWNIVVCRNDAVGASMFRNDGHILNKYSFMFKDDASKQLSKVFNV